jgi:hypothetical protein
MRTSYTEEYIPAGMIKPGDYLVRPRSFHGRTDDRLTTRRADVGFCEFIGHHLGDGFTTKSGTIGFSHGADDAHLEHYSRNLEKCFSKVDDVYQREKMLDRKVNSSLRDANTTTICNIAAYRELLQLGLVGASKTKRLPEWAFRLSQENRIAIVRGYLDSDGTVNKNGIASFTSVNRELLDDMRHLALLCGLNIGKICVSYCRDNFSAEGGHMLYKFHMSSPEDVMRVAPYTPSYVARARAALEKRKPRVCKKYPCESMKHGENEYVCVSEIMSEPAETVFDLSVEGKHSFLADGFIVHNSNIEHQGIEYVQDTLLPWLVRWEEEVDAKLLPEGGELFSKFAVQALMRGDSVARSNYYRNQLMIGSMSINEIRALEDMNGIGPQGDQYYMQTAMTTIEAINAGATAPADKAEDEPASEEESSEEESSDMFNEMDDEAKAARAGMMRPVVSAAIARCWVKEEKATARARTKYQAANAQDDLARWWAEFRQEQAAYFAESMAPALSAVGCGPAEFAQVRSYFDTLYDSRAVGDGIDPVAVQEEIISIMRGDHAE